MPRTPEQRAAHAARERRRCADGRCREAKRRSQARRRQRLKAAFVDAVTVEGVRLRTGSICGICLRAVGAEAQIDHIVPLARGGEHSYANAQLAHPTCNRVKYAA